MLSTSFWVRREALNFTSSSSLCIHRFYPIPCCSKWTEEALVIQCFFSSCFVKMTRQITVWKARHPAYLFYFGFGFFSCTDACCNVVTSIDRDVIATCEHHVNTWYAVENVDVEHKIGMVVILQVNGRLLNAMWWRIDFVRTDRGLNSFNVLQNCRHYFFWQKFRLQLPIEIMQKCIANFQRF